VQLVMVLFCLWQAIRVGVFQKAVRPLCDDVGDIDVVRKGVPPTTSPGRSLLRSMEVSLYAPSRFVAVFC
jgi:hypothetical protein